MSNSFDPDQVRHFVGPGLGPNCLQRLSADHTSRQRVNLNRSILKWEKKYKCLLHMTMKIQVDQTSLIASLNRIIQVHQQCHFI